MKKWVYLILVLALFAVNAYADTSAVKRSTFGNEVSGTYAIEEKNDDVIYFRPTGGVKWGYEVLTTNDTLTDQETGKTFVMDAGGYSVPIIATLPTAEVGMEFTFIGADDITYILSPQSTDTIVWSDAGTSLAAGDDLQSPGGTGDTAVLFAGAANTWYVTLTNGDVTSDTTWSDGTN